MAATTAMFFAQWVWGFNVAIYVVYLYLSIAVTVIAHNHNHIPIWRGKKLNALTDYWLTIFYGFPAFAWIPTHNMNHHALNNREGDYTITYRLTEHNNLLMLLLYPTVSSYYQQKPIRDYLKRQWAEDRSYYWHCVSQYILLAVWIAVALIIDWKKALLFVVIPQQVGLFSVLIFNFVQHVHADEESEWNHSRNFVGFLNKMLFNNGYHTVHHEKARLALEQCARCPCQSCFQDLSRSTATRILELYLQILFSRYGCTTLPHTLDATRANRPTETDHCLVTLLVSIRPARWQTTK